MEIFLYIHYLVTLSFMILPFLPLKYLIKYKLFLSPLFLTLYWLIFDGCHLSKLHKNKNGYIQDLIYNIFNIKLTKSQAKHFISMTVCIIPTIIILRIIIYKNYFCKTIYK